MLKLKYIIPLLFIFAGIFILTLAADESSGGTIIVAQDGNGNYEKIQDAIDNATEGDTIRVWEGTYLENVVVNKTVNLRGNGSKETMIDGVENGDVVHITSDCVNMSGFTVTGGMGSKKAGIKIESNYNTLMNNNCSSNIYGIFLWNSSACTITNNTCKKNDNGIYLSSSSDSTITNNTCSENNRFGIVLKESSDGNTITNNTCTENNDDGIDLSSSSNCTIKNNICLSNSAGYGINIYQSDDCTISNNVCENNLNGIYLQYSNNCTLSNNTCSSNSMYGIYLHFSNNNTCENNTCENTGTGIQISSSSGCKLENNTCSSNDKDGISIEWTSYCTLENNICYSNEFKGIRLSSSNNCTITNNTCGNNDYGIFLGASSDCILGNNTCRNNDYYGIYILNSNGCTIANNTCNSNNKSGIYLLNSSDHNTITNNTCSSNNDYGISLVDSNDYCTITNNNGSIRLSTSSHSIITNNNGSISLSTSSHSIITNNNGSISLSTSSHSIITSNNGSISLSTSSHSIISNNTCSNRVKGINLFRSNDCTITNNTISENRVGIRLGLDSQGTTVRYNSIINSIEYGIDSSNHEDYTIDATNNWWGAPSGPYHPSENIEGKGDNVTDGVLFNPWLTDPDIRPPSANAGNDQTVYVNEEVRFVGTGEDPDGTIEKFEWDFNGDGSYDWDSESTGETTHPYPLKGTYHAVLRVTDDDGATATDNCEITVNDNIKPTILITSHTNNSKVSGTVTIYGSAADEDGIVEKVEISIDDDDWGIVTGTTSWTFDWDTRDSEDGESKIRARAFDGMNYSDMITWNLIVDNVPDNSIPTISITSPVKKTTVTGEVTIKGTASDPDGDETIEKVEVTINGENWIPITGTTAWSYTWDTTKEENGDYLIRVRSFDGTNYSKVTGITITVENKDDDGGGGGFIPGFGVVAVVGAVGISFTITIKKRRKEF